MQNIHLQEILKLSREEKILAVQKIWDSIADDTTDDTAPETLELLEKRWDSYKSGKSIALTLDEFKKRTEKARIR